MIEAAKEETTYQHALKDRKTQKTNKSGFFLLHLNHPEVTFTRIDKAQSHTSKRDSLFLSFGSELDG